MKLTYKEILSVTLLLVVIGIYTLLQTKPWQVGASVAVGNQYQSTTTPQVADLTSLCNTTKSTGILGSVNVLSGGTGRMDLLDATTSDVNLRTGNKATSTLYLASFPTGFGTTSPHFDIEFKDGLFVDYTTGVATSTISYRCEG